MKFLGSTCLCLSVLLINTGAAEFTSPEVHRDGRVTFRLEAPKASQVTLNGLPDPSAVPMTRDTNGVWTVTVGPLRPEIYSYTFSVDGATVTDPRNPWLKAWRISNSLVEVPGNPAPLFQEQPIQHGTVHQNTYNSKSLKRVRHLYVYTPPGYETRTTRAYPVLYLLHGSGDNESAWTTVGRVHIIADNLLSWGRMKEMIIVMPHGHASIPASLTGPTRPALSNNEAFERDLLEDVIPFVESHYRAQRGAGERAIAGLSMGGGQALGIGLNHLDTFRWIGAFSSSVPRGELGETFSALVNGPKKANKKLELLWIGCGRNDSLFDRSERFDEWLNQIGIDHQTQFTPGTHEWRLWRKYIADLMPLLF